MGRGNLLATTQTLVRLGAGEGLDLAQLQLENYSGADPAAEAAAVRLTPLKPLEDTSVDDDVAMPKNDEYAGAPLS